MPGGPWNDATDRQLLLSIIHVTGAPLPKWDQVAALMGNGYTAESTRQHFQKMRKDSRAKFGEPGSMASNGSVSPTKASGRKRKAANGETPKSKGKGKAAKNVEVDRDDDEDASPSKKVKAEAEEEDPEHVFM